MLDTSRGELKLNLELAGVEKGNIDLKAIDDEAPVTASGTDRKYRADINLRSPVDPTSAKAVYRNGIPEVTFSLKDKANKGYSKINVR